MDTPALLKVKDVATILGISQSSAYRLMQSSIPTVRFGRTVRVRREDLEHFIRLCSKYAVDSNGDDLLLIL